MTGNETRKGSMGVQLEGATASELVASVRAQAAAGALAPGDVLPPIRTLATRLGLNRNTVAAAYAQLTAAGLVQTRRRAGTVILGPASLEGEGHRPDAGVTDLSSGNPDPAYLPGVSGLLDGYRPTLYGVDPISPVLRHWAARHLAPDAAGPHRLVLTDGAVDAVTRLLDVRLVRGDAVAVEEPGFLSSVGALGVGGYTPAPVRVDEHGMTVDGLRDALAAGARAVVCTPRAHNPTGASLTPARATALRSLLAKHPDLLIIEDDHFAQVSSRPYARITPRQAPRWALVRSVSKYLGPDLRLAFVLADPDTAARLESVRSSPAIWVSHILQHLVARLLTDPDTATLLEQARRAYAERIGLLAKALTRRGLPPRAADGLNLWLPVPGTIEEHAVQALAERGWGVRPGAHFSAIPRPPAAIRVTTATITAEQADHFAADLAAVLKS